jgi:hypothetical protein
MHETPGVINSHIPQQREKMNISVTKQKRLENSNRESCGTSSDEIPSKELRQMYEDEKNEKINFYEI